MYHLRERAHRSAVGHFGFFVLHEDAHDVPPEGSGADANDRLGPLMSFQEVANEIHPNLKGLEEAHVSVIFDYRSVVVCAGVYELVDNHQAAPTIGELDVVREPLMCQLGRGPAGNVASVCPVQLRFCWGFEVPLRVYLSIDIRQVSGVAFRDQRSPPL